MSYSTTISALDLSGGVASVRVSAGYAFNVIEAPEQQQAETTEDFTALQFLSATPNNFSYPVSLAPQPSPAWFIALWIQEIPRISNATGWLFRSGGFTTDPPTDPIEIILAPEQVIVTSDIVKAVGALPMTSGSTTITAVTPSVVGKDIFIVAIGTDTSLPPTVTFTYTVTMELVANSAVLNIEPFTLKLTNPALSFTAGGPGHGLEVFILNAVRGIILNTLTPRIKNTLTGLINSGVLANVASQLNRNMPAQMPPGVILSIRNVRSTVQSTTSLPAIGVLGALGAFGGVLNKFPALTQSSSACLVTMAMGRESLEAATLRAWRESFLRPRWSGRLLIRMYESLSPPLASIMGRSKRLRAYARKLVVSPAARWAGARVQAMDPIERSLRER